MTFNLNRSDGIVRKLGEAEQIVLEDREPASNAIVE
jgi:hypothetical protein